LLLAGFAGAAAAQEIKIGGIMDMTGATSDVGKDYAMGMAEAFKYINEQGGVNGKKIRYTWFDYGYRIPEAITKYSSSSGSASWRSQGWGTGRHRSPLTDGQPGQMPYPSASYSAHLTDPAKTPYNLFARPTTHQCQGRPDRLVRQEVAQARTYGKRKPRLACSYMFAFPYAAPRSRPSRTTRPCWALTSARTRMSRCLPLDTKSQVMAMKISSPTWSGTATPRCRCQPPSAMPLPWRGADHIVNNWALR
jgi:branched-chain amino acid transport system substrate-binding protein